MKAPDRMKHFKITHTNDQYVIGQRSFGNMEELISHYEKAPIYTTEAGQKMFLVQPISKALTQDILSSWSITVIDVYLWQIILIPWTSLLI